MIIETPTPAVIDEVAQDAYARSGAMQAWVSLPDAVRGTWRAAAARFLTHYALTPRAAIGQDEEHLESEGWRWGWEFNDQLKTDPRLNIHAPEITPYRNLLQNAYDAAHARIDRRGGESPK